MTIVIWSTWKPIRRTKSIAGILIQSKPDLLLGELAGEARQLVEEVDRRP